MNGGSAGQPMTTPPIRSRRGNLEHPQEQEQFTKAAEGEFLLKVNEAIKMNHSDWLISGQEDFRQHLYQSES